MAKVAAIVRATPGLARRLAKTIREADAKECAMAGLASPVAGILFNLTDSTFAFAAVCNGQVLAMGGMRSGLLCGVGESWLVTGQGFEAHAMQFTRELKRQVATMLTMCDRVEARVDPTYGKAIRLLRALGFRQTRDEGPWLVMTAGR